MRAREFVAYLAAVGLAFVCLFVVVVPEQHPPVVKKTVVKKLALPVKFGPGDLLMATAGLKPLTSQFYEDKERGMLVQCDQYADAKKASKMTVAFQVCYFDTVPPKPAGRPELGS